MTMSNNKTELAIDIELGEKEHGTGIFIPVPPLLAAVVAADLEGLKSNLGGSNLLEVNDLEQTALHIAANHDDRRVALTLCEELLKSVTDGSSQDLLSRKDTQGQTPLMLAAGKGNKDVLQLFLERGAGLGYNNWNETVFHLLSFIKNHQLSVECAELLFDPSWFGNDIAEMTAYLNAEEKRHYRGTMGTALHYAAKAGNAQLMQFLISRGVNVGIRDRFGSTVLHYAVDKGVSDVAVKCTFVTLQAYPLDNWDGSRAELLEIQDIWGRCPIHIAALRGNDATLGLLVSNCVVKEKSTGRTALHLAASLGNRGKARCCVKELLQSFVGTETEKEWFINNQTADGATALYLAAINQNDGACEELLLAGAKLDIKTRYGDTPFEVIYKNVPQVARVQLSQAVQESGYVSRPRAIDAYVELDYGRILGYSSSPENLYKESEELGKIRSVRFQAKKDLLLHLFIRIFIYLKWNKIKNIFFCFRLIHMFWFLLNGFLTIKVYRTFCPNQKGKEFSWTSLRPGGDANATSILTDCDLGNVIEIGAVSNLVALFLYGLSQVHQTKQRFSWYFRSAAPTSGSCGCFETVRHYVKLIFKILPIWSIIFATGLVLTNLPMLKVQVLPTNAHYFIASIMVMIYFSSVSFELVKFPAVRVHINFLTKSAKKMFWAIGVVVPILMGFAGFFVMTMAGKPFSSSFPQSVTKVLAFMIGELDYDELLYPDNDDSDNRFSGLIMILVVGFILCVILILVNYFIGYAAGEIMDVYERTEIWKLSTQLEQIVLLEAFLDKQISCFGREFLKHTLMLMPPKWDKETNELKPSRRVEIYVPGLPVQMQKEVHELNLETIREESY